MLKKRIIVCLDVCDGKVMKGVKFKDNNDIGDPVALAQHYYETGVDELVLYDITASYEHRAIMDTLVKKVAKHIYIPFTVGGGIQSVKDMHNILSLGAEKVSVNSLAVLNPSIIDEGAKFFGSQCIVLGMDVLATTDMPSGYCVVIRGGRENTNKDALAWAREAVERGVGEIVLNSIDTDGTKNGYECIITKLISEAVSVPVIASGGAGTPEHLIEVLSLAKADAALVASMVHYGTYSIADIKKALSQAGIAVRE